MTSEFLPLYSSKTSITYQRSFLYSRRKILKRSTLVKMQRTSDITLACPTLNKISKTQPKAQEHLRREGGAILITCGPGQLRQQGCCSHKLSKI